MVQFVRPEIAASIDQLTKVQSVAERFSRQGVVFVAVCDARSSRDKMRTIADEPNASNCRSPWINRLSLHRVQPPIHWGSSSRPPLSLSTGGKVRAAGLKPDFLDKVLNGLLAEPLPIANESDVEAVEEANADKVV